MSLSTRLRAAARQLDAIRPPERLVVIMTAPEASVRASPTGLILGAPTPAGGDPRDHLTDSQRAMIRPGRDRLIVVRRRPRGLETVYANRIAD